MEKKQKDYLALKWGSLKEWSFHSKEKEMTALMKEYNAEGVSMSAIAQHDTLRQKEIICELIDLGDFKKVYLDWDGKWVTKKQAKKYVMEYSLTHKEKVWNKQKNN